MGNITVPRTYEHPVINAILPFNIDVNKRKVGKVRTLTDISSTHGCRMYVEPKKPSKALKSPSNQLLAIFLCSAVFNRASVKSPLSSLYSISGSKGVMTEIEYTHTLVWATLLASSFSLLAVQSSMKTSNRNSVPRGLGVDSG